MTIVTWCSFAFGIVVFIDLFVYFRNKKKPENKQEADNSGRPIFKLYKKSPIFVTGFMIIALLFSVIYPSVEYVNYLPDGKYIYYVDIKVSVKYNTSYERTTALVGVENGKQGMEYYIISIDNGATNFLYKEIVPNHSTKITDDRGKDWICTLTTNRVDNYKDSVTGSKPLSGVILGSFASICILLWLIMFVFKGKSRKKTEQSIKLATVNDDSSPLKKPILPKPIKKNRKMTAVYLCSFVFLVVCTVILWGAIFTGNYEINEDSAIGKGIIGFMMAFAIGIISAIYTAIKNRLNKKYHTENNAQDNEIYIGEWKDGKRHGQGTLNYMDGSNYVGEFKDGKRNGTGTYTNANGEKNTGEFKDDVFIG